MKKKTILQQHITRLREWLMMIWIWVHHVVTVLKFMVFLWPVLKHTWFEVVRFKIKSYWISISKSSFFVRTEKKLRSPCFVYVAPLQHCWQLRNMLVLLENCIISNLYRSCYFFHTKTDVIDMSFGYLMLLLFFGSYGNGSWIELRKSFKSFYISITFVFLY